VEDVCRQSDNRHRAYRRRTTNPHRRQHRGSVFVRHRERLRRVRRPRM